MREIIKKEQSRSRPKAVAILETIQNQNLNVIGTTEGESRFSNTEAGVIHPRTGSGLKLFDNGNLVLADSYGDGIFINKEKTALLLNAKQVSVNSKVFQVKTRPDGFIINGRYLNPDALASGQVQIVQNGITSTVPLFIALDSDTEFEDLLKDFGILT